MGTYGRFHVILRSFLLMHRKTAIWSSVILPAPYQQLFLLDTRKLSEDNVYGDQKKRTFQLPLVKF